MSDPFSRCSCGLSRDWEGLNRPLDSWSYRQGSHWEERLGSSPVIIEQVARHRPHVNGRTVNAEGTTFATRGTTGRCPISPRKPTPKLIVVLFWILLIIGDWCWLKATAEGPTKIKSTGIASDHQGTICLSWLGSRRCKTNHKRAPLCPGCLLVRDECQPLRHNQRLYTPSRRNIDLLIVVTWLCSSCCYITPRRIQPSWLASGWPRFCTEVTFLGSISNTALSICPDSTQQRDTFLNSRLSQVLFICLVVDPVCFEPLSPIHILLTRLENISRPNYMSARVSGWLLVSGILCLFARQWRFWVEGCIKYFGTRCTCDFRSGYCWHTVHTGIQTRNLSVKISSGCLSSGRTYYPP